MRERIQKVILCFFFKRHTINCFIGNWWFRARWFGFLGSPNWKGFRKGIEMYSFIFTSQTFLLTSNLELITQPISTMQTLSCLRNDWRKIHTPSCPSNVVLQGIFCGASPFSGIFCCNKKSAKDKLSFIQVFFYYYCTKVDLGCGPFLAHNSISNNMTNKQYFTNLNPSRLLFAANIIRVFHSAGFILIVFFNICSEIQAWLQGLSFRRICLFPKIVGFPPKSSIKK